MSIRIASLVSFTGLCFAFGSASASDCPPREQGYDAAKDWVLANEKCEVRRLTDGNIRYIRWCTGDYFLIKFVKGRGIEYLHEKVPLALANEFLSSGNP